MRTSQGHTFRGDLLESWLALTESFQAHPDVRERLFDRVTGLPTAPLLVPRALTILNERDEVSALCVSVVRHVPRGTPIERATHCEVARAVGQTLIDIVGTVLRDADLVGEVVVAGDAFIVVLSPPRTTRWMEDDARAMLAERVGLTLRERLGADVPPTLLSTFDCYVGSATVRGAAGASAATLMRTLVEAAAENAAAHARCDAQERGERVAQVLSDGGVRTLVRPVFDLTDSAIVGYQTVPSGPEGSGFETPETLSAAACAGGLASELDRACCAGVFEVAALLPPGRTVFFDIRPEGVAALCERVRLARGVDPSELNHIVVGVAAGLGPSSHVELRAVVELVGALGFSVAVADAVAAFAVIPHIATSRPHWIKVDFSLARACGLDSLRESLLGSVAAVAESIDARLVVEDVRTADELATVRAAGVRYAQGPYYGEPAPPVGL